MTLIGGSPAYFGVPLLMLQVTGCTYDMVAANAVMRGGPDTWWVDTADGVAEVGVGGPAQPTAASATPPRTA